MGTLPTVDLITHLTLGVVHQYLALTTLDKHNQSGDTKSNNHQQQHQRYRERARPGQLQSTEDRIGQTGGNTCEDNQRYSVTQAALRNLLAQPHQKHGSSDQSDHRG